ncbi:MAG: alpha-glucan family phosphorylase [Acidobacteriota bacterium]|nr:MAG: alpha-glucan family phosphorylase [Acidobacteriota bacterium]
MVESAAPEIARDPVCGMSVLAKRALIEHRGGEPVYFCSAYCRDRFIDRPDKFSPRRIRETSKDQLSQRKIAYFSMEVALGPGMGTYAGGLGVLAGDTLKSAADLRVPIVGVSLLSRKGYFRQRLDEQGNQWEEPAEWDSARFLRLLSPSIEITIEGRTVLTRAWRYDIIGVTGHTVPVLLLDTSDANNSEQDRALTDALYGGDDRYRLAQEVVLGIGGVKLLHVLGYDSIERYHLNEGHASLLVVELLKEATAPESSEWDFETVRRKCVFTTHTPVEAGHDRFDYDLVERVLGRAMPLPRDALRMLGGDEQLNMTLLGFNLSHYLNGVAMRHRDVSRRMFPAYAIEYITNGVHSYTWTSDAFRSLYDRHISGWQNDPALLRKALHIPKGELWEAHMTAKRRLVSEIEKRSRRSLSPEVFTIGFARRATAYKRADLVFADTGRLLELAASNKKLQLVFAGKAHPRDESGKELIRNIVRLSRELGGEIPVVYLEDYDLALAALMVSGCDLWLNTPEPPLEASGTSGMKAAHNGVPSLSTLDGWWLEGHIEGVTGWSIGSRDPASPPSSSREGDAEELYRKLQDRILPLFYQNRDDWIEVMRHAIALNASYFNTHRMVQQYATSAYLE